MKAHFDHVALLVRDLKAAVADYQRILGVLTPEEGAQIVWVEGEHEGYPYRAATFAGREGRTVLQFIESQHPRDQERLQKRGEGVHHFEFCTDDVAEAGRALGRSGVELASEAPVVSSELPWLEAITVSPKTTHGVLVKVTTRYRVVEGKWVKA